ncbi:enoyl-(acyl-carrier-protein) reductase (NADH) [Synechococcus sp. PCC 7502]|uniref:enoyl-ACP reductase FabI n=1 Tax=Synechococcus sp. PCC 7502 TaxID=1173263 RepID=UPI00029F841A|nr:enoyl-ACP reductase FabI [Synechococcus sp. PCC 7502]AFY73900.1 enoyl-(acyl-carrier-protein) reductase (NADH) [Synechococcus sp. PCC 7502]
MLDLSGKTALVTGIANNRSIAWGIAQQLHKAGAKLAITYLPDDRDRTLSKVKDLVSPLSPDLLLPCDVQNDTQIDEMYGAIAKSWGKLDILIHCLAFAKKEELSGNFTDISRDGFKLALDVSAFSLISLCKGARPLMTDGGSVITLTYIGGVKVVPNYNVMGIAKAALEMNVRYLAQDLGSQNIRVNGISAGPIRTLASAAIGDIHKMLHHVEEVSPLKRLVSQVEVGNVAAFLASDLSSAITGQVIYADCGYEIMGA